MYDFFIKKYINEKLTIDSISNFAKNENIILEDKEKEVLYTYIKKYWYQILHEDANKYFNEVKDKLRPNTYNKMIELYNKYKKRYF